jgi:hypothetical protein
MSDKALQIIALALRFSRAVQEDWVREHDILINRSLALEL